MTERSAVVHVVDDDAAVRDALHMLLESAGYANRTYASATQFLEACDSTQPGCIVADIRMPGMSGLELQDELREQGVQYPIIFITGHGDIPMAVDAMKSGALDFLQKPFQDQDLLDRIELALRKDREQRDEARVAEAVRERMRALTPREREVMARVVRGDANKVIALDLEVSQRTVELHRARVMRKMAVRSVAQLVRAVELAER